MKKSLILTGVILVIALVFYLGVKSGKTIETILSSGVLLGVLAFIFNRKRTGSGNNGEEVVDSLALISMSLKEFGNDIETLTEDWKKDSESQDLRLDNLETNLNEIDNVFVDLKELEQGLETLQMNWTTLLNEFKKKELIEDIIQWTLIGLLSAYATKDTWINLF